MYILQFPHPLLKTVCAPVSNFNKELAALSKRMVKTMKKAGGCGLSANQVGIPLQVCVFKLKGVPETMVNPEIVKFDDETQTGKEGCLSLRNQFFEVKRPKGVTIRWIDLEGNPHLKRFTNFAARAIIHEIEHLHGFFFLESEEQRQKNRMVVDSDGKLKSLDKMLEQTAKRIKEDARKEKESNSEKRSSSEAEADNL